MTQFEKRPGRRGLRDADRRRRSSLAERTVYWFAGRLRAIECTRYAGVESGVLLNFDFRVSSGKVCCWFVGDW